MLGKSEKMTPQKAALAKAMRAAGFTTHYIAAKLKVNQGRISEVCTSKTFADVKPADRRQLSLFTDPNGKGPDYGSR